MSTRWIDVSIPLKEGMAVWPGDNPFEFTAARRIAEGAGSNVSKINMNSHTGTHVDAPWHFEEDGKRLDEIDTSVFFGEVLLLDFSEAEEITVDLLGETPLPSRIIFKTRNSSRLDDDPFDKEFLALNAEIAQRLVEDGVKLVGVDGPSVDYYEHQGRETHHRLLRNDVLIVEGLRLADLEGGTYRFVVLPLPIIGADGAPCRAFIGKEVSA